MGASTQSRRYLLVVAGLLAVVSCTAQRPTPSASPAPAERGSFAVPARSGTFGVQGHPQLVAAGAGAVWVLNVPSPDAAERLPNAGFLLRRPFPGGTWPVLMAVGEGSVWVTLDGARQALAEVDPGSMRVTRTTPLRSAGGVAVGGGRVWVNSPQDGTVQPLDPVTGRAAGPPARVGTEPAGLVVGEGWLWVLHWERDLLTRVDLDGRRVEAPVPAGPDAFELAVGAGWVWITNRQPGTVTRIDARTGRPVGATGSWRFAQEHRRAGRLSLGGQPRLGQRDQAQPALTSQARRPWGGLVAPLPWGDASPSTMVSPRHTNSPMTADEFTDELAIDLANTLNLQPDGTTTDLLATGDGLARWLQGTGGPGAVGSAPLQALRGHVLALLAAAVEQRSLPQTAVAAVNIAAAAAPTVAQLEADELMFRSNASPPDAFLAEIATSAITLVGGPRRDRLRLCAAPGCGRWFLASRPRQIWCSPSCGNRARLARFQQRRRAA